MSIKKLKEGAFTIKCDKKLDDLTVTVTVTSYFILSFIFFWYKTLTTNKIVFEISVIFTGDVSRFLKKYQQFNLSSKNQLIGFKLIK